MKRLCLNAAARDALQTVWQTTDDPSLPRRIQAILDEDDGEQTASVAKKFGVSHQTIDSWIERIQSDSVPSALADQMQCGRPRD